MPVALLATGGGSALALPLSVLVLVLALVLALAVALRRYSRDGYRLGDSLADAALVAVAGGTLALALAAFAPSL